MLLANDELRMNIGVEGKSGSLGVGRGQWLFVDCLDATSPIDELRNHITSIFYTLSSRHLLSAT
jgi:hypothetical protein